MRRASETFARLIISHVSSEGVLGVLKQKNTREELDIKALALCQRNMLE